MQVLLGTNIYEVLETGEILKVRGSGYLKTFPDKDGYLRVSVTDKGGVTHNEAVHRVVYRSFKGDIPIDMTVDHRDGDKLNNHKDNLQLLSNVDNAVKGNASVWLVTDPLGKLTQVYNLAKFCRDNDLHKGHLSIGKYRGWKSCKLK